LSVERRNPGLDPGEGPGSEGLRGCKLSQGCQSCGPAVDAKSRVHALALYFHHYNFQRLHKTLRVTPAMAAGISKELLSWEAIIELVDQVEQKAAVAKRWALLKSPQ
jgi:hypothetical protein